MAVGTSLLALVLVLQILTATAKMLKPHSPVGSIF
jgi:hypothetical protein